MKRRFSLVLAISAILGSACSSAKDEAPTTNAGTKDTLEMPASDTTRSELGVVKWGIERGNDGSTVVRGYDASNTATVEFAQDVSQGASATFQASLRSKQGVAKMKLSIESAPAPVKMLENTFASDAEAQRVLARIISDLGTQPKRDIVQTKSTNAIASTPLNELGLVDGNSTSLISACSKALVSSTAAGANTVDACKSGEKSSGCDTSARQTSKEKSNVQNCQSSTTCTPPDTSNLAACSPDRAKCAVPLLERALLDTIAFTEGTAGSCGNDGYTTGFNYHCFDSCASHPNIYYSEGDTTAAGRYQFLDVTWKGLGMSDFGPANQDIAAMKLVRGRGVTLPTDRPMNSSEFQEALRLLGPEWSSLPWSPNHQPRKTYAETRQAYCSAVQTLGAGSCTD